MHERIYDYALYNDLGNPDKNDDVARPSSGGNERPYPRRCRTGRSPTRKGVCYVTVSKIFYVQIVYYFLNALLFQTDSSSESRIEKPHPIYVPRDEAFEEIKQNTFSAGRLKALLHNLIPLIASTLSSSDNPFTCFSEIDKLYNDGVLLKSKEQNYFLNNQHVSNLLKQIFTAGERLLKYDTPAIIKSMYDSLSSLFL